MRHLLLGSVFLILSSVPSFAKEKNETQVRMVEDKMANKEDVGDPNRVICRKQNDTGSRLTSKRICLTAAEWSAMKSQNRQAVERTQSSRTTN